MNKTDIAAKLAAESLMPFTQAEKAVSAFFEAIVDGLMAEGRTELRGFGSFQLKEYAGYRGRNPKTGAPIVVPPKRLPVFKASRALRELVAAGA